MRKPREAARVHRAGLALLAAVAAIAMLAAGCDSRVDVRGPRVNLPTVPTAPTTPSGATVTETRAISGVTGVAHDGVGLVQIELGAFEQLIVTAPESIMPRLTSEVVNGRLILDLDAESYQGQVTDIQFGVRLRQLDELIHAGVGKMTARGIDTPRLDVQMSGVGDVEAAGRADRQEVRMEGLGNYLAAALESRVTWIDMRAGDGVIWASERIEGHVAFGCTLEYHGNPEVDVSGGGTVRKIGFGS